MRAGLYFAKNKLFKSEEAMCLLDKFFAHYKTHGSDTSNFNATGADEADLTPYFGDMKPALDDFKLRVKNGDFSAANWLRTTANDIRRDMFCGES